MKSIQQWLDEYKVSHQNPTNKLIHWICVPTIFFTIVGLLYSIPNPFPFLENTWFAEGIFGKLALIFVTVYYALLSVSLSAGMFLYSVICLFICHLFVASGLPLTIFCTIIFVLAWIAQFYGHNEEGKKPSFLKDIQFLMIGPAWVMSYIYGKIGLKY